MNNFIIEPEVNYSSNLPIGCKKIIAITGKAGAGKDTIGDYLCQTHFYKKFSFAYPIRQIIKAAFNLSDNQIYDREYKDVPLPNFPNMTVRKALQLVGTDMFRDSVDKDIWAKNMIYRIHDCPSDLIVITDLRFPNEQDVLVKYYGNNCMFLKITKDGCNGNVGVSNHESESYDLKCDITIENNSTKPELYETIEYIINKTNFSK